MLKVQEYLLANGIIKLQEEHKIEVRDYPDRVILNYSQFDSDKYNPIASECRALILRKDENWSVMAQAYVRFLNVGEDKRTAEFPITSPKTRVESKIDGSLILFFWDDLNQKWQPASRSCAFAEGQTVLGNTFADVFWRAVKNSDVAKWVESNIENRKVTWIFELCSPENRVITPFENYKVVLTGARDITTGQEFNGEQLDKIAPEMKVERPERFAFKSIQEAIDKANSLSSMLEGYVLVFEEGLSYFRLKCKNSKYLSLSNLRGNGSISPKRILKLVMENDTEEYLGYFESDRPFFDFVQTSYDEMVEHLTKTYNEYKNIENQKEFALTIIPKCVYPFEAGIMFSCRKSKKVISAALKESGNEKIAEGMKLKEKFVEKFSVKVEENA
jgi:hypothetical protein